MSNPPFPPMPPSNPAYPPLPRSWWSRNWKWVVPVGCLTPLVICGGLLTLIISVGLGALKSTEPYTESLAKAKAHPQVQAAIGTPIEPAFLITGTINLNNDAGDADIHYGVSGPKGEGTIYVTGTKAAGEWTYQSMEFRDSTGQTIDLIAP